MSRIPTFRRRFKNLVKVLYIEAVQAAASDSHIGGILNPGKGAGSVIGSKDTRDGETMDIGRNDTRDNGSYGIMGVV